ncbi:TSUP family transporter, partial [Bacteroidota bacterium]
STTMGVLGGFTTMIGNAAGPVMSIYLLSMRLNKNSFIGTAAWFFFVINIFKVPLHIIFWKTITINTFLLNLLAFPVIVGGVFTGIYIVKIFNEKNYRILVLASTFITAILLIFK